MDVGFVILCPDRNIGGLKNTVGSITFHSYDRDALAVVGNDVSATELKNLKQVCETHKGEDTITSLINVGMKKLKHDWACIIFSASRIPMYIERKIENFAKADTDVLFPIIDRKMNFVEGSFNGVVINREFFKKVGDFPTSQMYKKGTNDFELAKMFWAMQAIQEGCTFKGIVGLRVI